MENKIETELLWKYENVEIRKQLNNFEYGNGYVLVIDGKFVGSWDRLEQLFEHDN